MQRGLSLLTSGLRRGAGHLLGVEGEIVVTGVSEEWGVVGTGWQAFIQPTHRLMLAPQLTDGDTEALRGDMTAPNAHKA